MDTQAPFGRRLAVSHDYKKHHRSAQNAREWLRVQCDLPFCAAEPGGPTEQENRWCGRGRNYQGQHRWPLRGHNRNAGEQQFGFSFGNGAPTNGGRGEGWEGEEDSADGPVPTNVRESSPDSSRRRLGAVSYRRGAPEAGDDEVASGDTSVSGPFPPRGRPRRRIRSGTVHVWRTPHVRTRDGFPRRRRRSTKRRFAAEHSQRT